MKKEQKEREQMLKRTLREAKELGARPPPLRPRAFCFLESLKPRAAANSHSPYAQSTGGGWCFCFRGALRRPVPVE